MRKPILKTSAGYDNSTLYAVSKKDFDIKQVTIELRNANGDVKEVRTLTPIHHKVVVFKLTNAEQQTGVRVCVSDMADRITVWNMASGKITEMYTQVTTNGFDEIKSQLDNLNT